MKDIEEWIKKTSRRLEDIKRASRRLIGMTYLRGTDKSFPDVDRETDSFRFILYAAESIDLKKLEELIEKENEYVR